MKSNTLRCIDIHGHLNFPAFDVDREDAIKRSRQAGVGMISVGTHMETSKKAVELAEKYDDMWAIIGLHPVHTSKSFHDEDESGKDLGEIISNGEVADLEMYKMLAQNKKVVGIGECGLDYYRSTEDSIENQRSQFEAMIDIANEANKPLMLHLRNGSDRSAYRDAYEILKVRARVVGDLHFFAGDIEEAKLFLDLGYSFSFTGVITFARNYDEVIKYIPMERMMSETDCPYVAPMPHRGKRNEPAYVVEVIKAIAKIRSLEEGIVSKRLLTNAIDFFGLRV